MSEVDRESAGICRINETETIIDVWQRGKQKFSVPNQDSLLEPLIINTFPVPDFLATVISAPLILLPLFSSPSIITNLYRILYPRVSISWFIYFNSG